MQILEIDYNLGSAQAFDKLKDLDNAVFLDSSRADAAEARYDIISASPYLLFKTEGELTTIHSETGTLTSTDDPFMLLKAYLKQQPANTHPPFSGGAIGYFAYDLGRRIEMLPTLAKRDILIPDMYVGLYDWALVFDHQQQKAWIASAHNHPSTKAVLNKVQACLKAKPKAHDNFQLLSPFKSNMTHENYAQAFKTLKAHIHCGDCFQANLAQRFSATTQGNAWPVYQHLRGIHPTPFSAYLGFDDAEILSISPERFLHLKDQQVETKPIKGTRPRGADPNTDQQWAQVLLASEKDRAENVMIVDLMRNDIGKVCAIGSVNVSKLCALESFTAVHHLVSTVHGQLPQEQHALDLLRACFPGGSITGAPKIRAMEISETLEPHRRSVYCGSIGYIGFDGNMDSNICIRTFIHTAGHIHGYAGGGIVADSKVNQEYQETFDKVQALLETIEHRFLF